MLDASRVSSHHYCMKTLQNLRATVLRIPLYEREHRRSSIAESIGISSIHTGAAPSARASPPPVQHYDTPPARPPTTPPMQRERAASMHALNGNNKTDSECYATPTSHSE